MRSREKEIVKELLEAQWRARFSELEGRVRLLEARIRLLSAESRRVGPSAKARASRLARRSRPRPRCPGCVLELPPGKRKESCVWCGFRFDAVGGLRR